MDPCGCVVVSCNVCNLQELVMVVGIDTYHHRPKKQRSVMAVVFTLNSQCTKYYTRTVLQGIGVETGDTLAPIFADAYVEFYKASHLNEA